MERIIRFLIQEISSLEGCQLIKNKAGFEEPPCQRVALHWAAGLHDWCAG